MSKYSSQIKQCNVPACINKYWSSGLCKSHYNMSRYETNSHLRQYMTRKGFQYKPAYASYMNMLQRCYNKNNMLYKYYGGRGIRVCDRWLESFDNFYADMGDRNPGMGIDRINNDGHYEPSNCRWTTQSEQNKNKRYNGKYH